jgi:glycosyltransferase involved in cell wall biosynthesis
MNEIGIVVIGRNEGERLRRCLESVTGRGWTLVYVDSGSDDGSVPMASALGVEVVALDMSVPFSAARARNAGVDRLREINPSARYVQFVDGDCELIDGWIEQARAELDARPDVAAICGRLHERFPDRSIYNRLADLEWDAPAGPTANCGGIAMMRLDAFHALGGFDPSVTAGEEPELCQRLRDEGWSIVRLSADMAWHDSAILSFRQWWRRTVRGGYGGMDVASRFARGRDGLFVGQLRSARRWTIGWTLAVIVSGTVGALLGGPVAGVLAVSALVLVLLAQVFRLAWRCRRRIGLGQAMVHGALSMLAKWGSLAGQLLYLRDRVKGRHARLIEYKSSGARAVRAATTP